MENSTLEVKKKNIYTKSHAQRYILSTILELLGIWHHLFISHNKSSDSFLIY